jgi:hypothetical protein
MKCRHCGAVLHHPFLDLGFAPPSNAYLDLEDLSRPEKTFPLRVKVCDRCWLVQTEDYAQADELFRADYAYYSSTSSSWLAHARDYCRHITNLLRLDSGSHVVEVASNDGYLLRNFVAAGIPCLGIEPTAGTAEAARALGIPVLCEFFGESLARNLAGEGRAADLIVGNNVYAHVPDINDFTRGLAALLKPQGVVTLEFPHLMQLLGQAQFDTVYHEHFSYLSLTSVIRIFGQAGLRVWDVEQLPTHGGSLRVYGCLERSARTTSPRVARALSVESNAGLTSLQTYQTFQVKADRIKYDLLLFLIEQKQAGRRVAAYGAAAKGNTLLNYAGVRPDLLPSVCDAAKSKQGKYLPGSHIPILSPDVLFTMRPDFVLVLPWNLASEVRQQLAPLAAQGTRFVTAVPRLEFA